MSRKLVFFAAFFLLFGGLALVMLHRYSVPLRERIEAENALREELGSLRDAIARYRESTGCPPRELAVLVEAGNLPELPLDPITQSPTTWKPRSPTEDEEATIDEGCEGPFVVDVRSGSWLVGLDGVPYNEW